jgi:hypothetical protein
MPLRDIYDFGAGLVFLLIFDECMFYSRGSLLKIKTSVFKGLLGHHRDLLSACFIKNSCYMTLKSAHSVGTFPFGNNRLCLTHGLELNEM